MALWPDQHYDHLVAEERPGCFAFVWSIACVLLVSVCLYFLFMLLLGYLL